jgi:hypothetical protein
MSSRSIASLRAHAVLVTAGIVLSLLVKSAITAADLWVLREFATVNPDLPSLPISPEAAQAVPGLELLLQYAGYADPLIFILAAIVFVVFLRLAYRNVMQPVIANRRYSPRWSVIAFLIPVVNLVMPYLVLREVWKCSRTLVRTHVDGHWEDERRPLLLPLWWISTLAAFVVMDIGTRLSSVAAPLGTPSVSTGIHLAGVGLYLAAGFLALRVVWKLTDMQWRMRVNAHRAERMRASGEPPHIEPWLDKMTA